MPRQCNIIIVIIIITIINVIIIIRVIIAIIIIMIRVIVLPIDLLTICFSIWAFMTMKDKLKRCHFMIQEISDPVFVVWIILSHKATLTVT